jgi:hypothetical protein
MPGAIIEPMRPHRLALLGSFALAHAVAARGADRAATPAAPSPPLLTYTGARFPPPGLPEDQALLGELLTTQRDMLDHRALALRTLQRLADARADVRLAEAARAAPDEARPRLEALHGRLVEAWGRARDLLVRRWPVDPRIGCRERGIAFEVLMPMGAAGGDSPRLAGVREDARRCLSKQAVPVSQLREANAALREIVPEVWAALGASPGTDAPGAGVAPAPASAATAPPAAGTPATAPGPMQASPPNGQR